MPCLVNRFRTFGFRNMGSEFFDGTEIKLTLITWDFAQYNSRTENIRLTLI